MLNLVCSVVWCVVQLLWLVWLRCDCCVWSDSCCCGCYVSLIVVEVIVLLFVRCCVKCIWLYECLLDLMYVCDVVRCIECSVFCLAWLVWLGVVIMLVVLCLIESVRIYSVWFDLVGVVMYVIFSDINLFDDLWLAWLGLVSCDLWRYYCYM